MYDLHDLSDVFLRMACLVSARPSGIWFSLAEPAHELRLPVFSNSLYLTAPGECG
ncbi:hypothetical protein ACFOHY_11300 [Rhizobium rosettiformans]|uniref:hypothetical protein n=1 Tax=Rhizobium rosettiformans TaxID=1368430 RepID=UPI003611BA01